MSKTTSSAPRTLTSANTSQGSTLAQPEVDAYRRPLGTSTSSHQGRPATDAVVKVLGTPAPATGPVVACRAARASAGSACRVLVARGAGLGAVSVAESSMRNTWCWG